MNNERFSINQYIFLSDLLHDKTNSAVNDYLKRLDNGEYDSSYKVGVLTGANIVLKAVYESLLIIGQHELEGKK